MSSSWDPGELESLGKAAFMWRPRVSFQMAATRIGEVLGLKAWRRHTMISSSRDSRHIRFQIRSSNKLTRSRR